jgi:hypothetical protein
MAGGFFIGNDGKFQIRSDGTFAITTTTDICTDCEPCNQCCCQNWGVCVTPQYIDLVISGWTFGHIGYYAGADGGDFEIEYVSGTLNGTWTLALPDECTVGGPGAEYPPTWTHTDNNPTYITFNYKTSGGVAPFTPSYTSITYTADASGQVSAYIYIVDAGDTAYATTINLILAEVEAGDNCTCDDTMTPTTYGILGISSTLSIVPQLSDPANVCNQCNQCPVAAPLNNLYCTPQKIFTLATDATGFSGTYTLSGGGPTYTGTSPKDCTLSCEVISGQTCWKVTIIATIYGGCQIVLTTPVTFTNQWDCIAPGTYDWTITCSGGTGCGTTAGTSISAISDGYGMMGEEMPASSPPATPSPKRPCGNCSRAR